MDELFTRGVTNIIDQDHLFQRLATDRPLRIKFGIDPTGPHIHLGRASTLWKLRAFQELGHKIILIIGDFTAQIGDASDKTQERPGLTAQDVETNLRDYLEQIGQIIDLEQCEVHYNSQWLNELSLEEIMRLTDLFSVSEMLDRDNFQKRFQSGVRISMREFMYPLLQGYDSVQVEADVEIGGNDQYFNLMAGRRIQKAYGQKPQDIITFEFLVGLDGRKMSTSWGNGVFITDHPQEMFGKLMSLNDDLIVQYFHLATDCSLVEIEEYQNRIQAGDNPRNIKMILAHRIVARYHGQEKAQQAENEFIQVFQEKDVPSNISEVEANNIRDWRPVAVVSQVFGISKSEARRVIQDGAIKKDQDQVLTLESSLSPDLTPFILQKGKRHFMKIISST